MAIQQVGNSMPPLFPEKGLRALPGPQSSGDASPPPAEDSTSISSGERGNDPPPAQSAQSTADTEGPDNYPSYGDKSDASARQGGKPKPETPAEPAIENSGEEYYIACGAGGTSTKKEPQARGNATAEGPDNYPNYGDKAKPADTLLTAGCQGLMNGIGNLPITLGPDNYPGYGDKPH
ncbi:MAG: hypothetical protein RDV48_13250 [Candidatus Eremiobacteraeota bacterium]|nr:hypothetical protein [Candidatus Eremiobacteraeota bacterium]